MNDTKLTELTQVQQFLHGTEAVDFKPAAQATRYSWIAKTLKRFNYHQLCKKDSNYSAPPSSRTGIVRDPGAWTQNTTFLLLDFGQSLAGMTAWILLLNSYKR